MMSYTSQEIWSRNKEALLGKIGYPKVTLLIGVGIWQIEVKWSEVAQLCPTLCDPMDCNLSGSSVHGIFQARVLEWIAISFSRLLIQYWLGQNCDYVQSQFGDMGFPIWLCFEPAVLFIAEPGWYLGYVISYIKEWWCKAPRR